jgi:uncharacterized protein YfaT (DUF1175 family)
VEPGDEKAWHKVDCKHVVRVCAVMLPAVHAHTAAYLHIDAAQAALQPIAGLLIHVSSFRRLKLQLGSAHQLRRTAYQGVSCVTQPQGLCA